MGQRGAVEEKSRVQQFGLERFPSSGGASERQRRTMRPLTCNPRLAAVRSFQRGPGGGAYERCLGSNQDCFVMRPDHKTKDKTGRKKLSGEVVAHSLSHC
ncbi:hypothetical protein EYF80_047980 [Liparis tanakae]|uniref:Uncharacterized protein n=1 Tax=Liparis tanakae TaxID=230148 RepID=A0A4Z2FLQ4_9TELE|nr:hypothetical protein EYF80_047980 [Liparis tanakae]